MGILNDFSKRKAQTDDQSGSMNFESRAYAGWVVGSAKYADEEPHHQRHDGGAWTYEQMHHAGREELLCRVIDERVGTAVAWVKESFPKLSADSVMDYERASAAGEVRARLMRSTGSVIDEVDLPTDLVMTSMGWDVVEQHNDMWVAQYYEMALGEHGE